MVLPALGTNYYGHDVMFVCLQWFELPRLQRQSTKDVTYCSTQQNARHECRWGCLQLGKYTRALVTNQLLERFFKHFRNVFQTSHDRWILVEILGFYWLFIGYKPYGVRRHLWCKKGSVFELRWMFWKHFLQLFCYQGNCRTNSGPLPSVTNWDQDIV